jgi:hypothetical protein
MALFLYTSVAPTDDFSVGSHCQLLSIIPQVKHAPTFSFILHFFSFSIVSVSRLPGWLNSVLFNARITGRLDLKYQKIRIKICIG